MPGLGIHRGRRTLGDFDNLLENGARHGLVLETTYASARLYQPNAAVPPPEAPPSAFT
jgi:hypothetical protein